MTADVHPILVPREIVNADSVFVVRWLVGEGEAVQPGTTLCEVETSKAVLNVDAERTGHVRRRANEGDEVPIGGVLGYLTIAADTPLPDAGLSDAAPPAAVAAVQISARARQKMAELGLDPALFAGRGFVKEKDVVDMAAQVHAAATAAHDPRGPFRLEPLGAIQRRVARVMSESVAAIPASTLERLIDLAPVRARARTLAGDSKAVVSEVDLLVAAVARAAAAHPRFNGFLADDYQLHRFERVNVGVAVDVEGDLYVVVVHDAAAKEPAAIAKELRGLQFLALRRRLTADHLSGGTITVTSMLGRGVHRFQPIPYPHQAAIIGLADPLPGSTQATLALVFDHRVANGSQAAAFLAAIDEGLRG
ncbi:2-oxo acid dehydrogenase subunit E2 [bacterium]|nr:2-oxo acid dehydrogenase subunit E2 [bacterium]